MKEHGGAKAREILALQAAPLHILCRLQGKRLRAWKRRSLRREISAGGRIRPEAYSSCSSTFRGLLDEWRKDSTRPAVLWIVTSYRLPGRRHMVPSLAAMIHVRQVYRGDNDRLTDELTRYVYSWVSSQKDKRPDPCQEENRHLCRVVEAEPALSRFYPANDMTNCLRDLQYVKRDGGRAAYSPRSILRVRPEHVHLLEEYAEAVARRTVFISYKHVDFSPESTANRPPWTVKALAEAFISGEFGVWVDVLCAPPRSEDSPMDLNSQQVRLLLKEGHAQSAVVIGVETENYLRPGAGGRNWTEGEYVGSVGGRRRDTPLVRFVLHVGTESKLKPKAHDTGRWSENLQEVIVPRVTRLFRRLGGW